jgi:hypothetical protein
MSPGSARMGRERPSGGSHEQHRPPADPSPAPAHDRGHDPARHQPWHAEALPARRARLLRLSWREALGADRGVGPVLSPALAVGWAGLCHRQWPFDRAALLPAGNAGPSRRGRAHAGSAAVQVAACHSHARRGRPHHLLRAWPQVPDGAQRHLLARASGRPRPPASKSLASTARR